MKLWSEPPRKPSTFDHVAGWVVVLAVVVGTPALGAYIVFKALVYLIRVARGEA